MPYRRRFGAGAVAARSDEPSDGRGSNPFINLFRDVGDVTTGLGQLLGRGAHDILVQAPQFAVGRDVDFSLDDIIKNLPTGIVEDVKGRYGSPSRFARGAVEHPGLLALDVLGLGSLASRAGKAAARGTLSRAGEDVGGVLTRASELGGEGAALREGLESLVREGRDVGTAGDLARRILPRSEPRMESLLPETGDRVAIRQVSQHENPVVRPFARFRELRRTEPIEVLQARVDDAKRMAVARPDLKNVAEQAAILQKVLDDATRLGVKRAPLPKASDAALARQLDRVAGSRWPNFIAKREDLLGEIRETFRPLADETVELADGSRKRLADLPDVSGEMQRLSVGLSSRMPRTVEGAAAGDPYAGILSRANSSEVSSSAPPITIDARSLSEGTQAAPSQISSVPTTSYGSSDPRNTLPSPISQYRIPISFPEEQAARLVQPHSTPEALLAAAGPAERELQGLLGDLFGQGVRGTRVKRLDRAEEKLAERGDIAEALGDAVGARVVVPSVTDLQGAVEKLRGIGEIRVKNHFAATDETGYRGINASVRLPSGIVAEVQFHTPTSLRAAEANQAAYDVYRTLKKQWSEAPIAERTPEMAQELAETLAYVRSHFAPVERELAEAFGGHAPSTVDRVMENARLLVAERFTNPMIKAGVLTPAKAFRRQYRPLMIQNGAEYDAALGRWVGSVDELTLHRQLENAGVTAPIYFPHVDTDRISLSGMFSDFLFNRGLHGARKAARPGFEKINRGYLLQKDAYLKNPAEAFTRRAARGLRWEETQDFVQAVLSKFGRKVESVEAVPPGWRLYDPDGLYRFYKMQIGFEDEVAKLARTAEGFDDAIAGALNRILPQIQPELADKVVREGIGAARVDIYAVPEAVAKRLQEHLTPLPGETRIRLFWDTPMNAWRWGALYMRPAWVLNNLVGNVLFAKMGGTKLRDVARILKEQATKRIAERHGKEAVTPTLDLLDAIGGKDVRSGFYGSQYTPKLGKASETRLGQLFQGFGEKFARSGPVRYGEAIKTLNSYLEDGFREAAYMNSIERQQAAQSVHRAGRRFLKSEERLRRIAKNGISPEMAAKAVEDVNRFFGDFTTMNPIERKIIRRFVAPFWGFYRHILKLTLTAPIEQPLRVEALRLLGQVSQEMSAELGPLPPWAERGAVPLGAGASPGDVVFRSTAGVNPFTVVTDIASRPTNLIAPPFQRAFEITTGRSSFTGRPFTAPDVVSDFVSGQQFRVGPGGEMEAIEKVTPSLFEMAAQTVVPGYGTLKQAAAGGRRTYDTSSLLDILGDRENALVPLRAGESGRNARDVLEQLLGIGTFPLDVASYQRRLRDSERRVRATYRRRVAPGS